MSARQVVVSAEISPAEVSGHRARRHVGRMVEPLNYDEADDTQPEIRLEMKEEALGDR